MANDINNTNENNDVNSNNDVYVFDEPPLIYENIVYRLNERRTALRKSYFVEFQNDPHSKHCVSFKISKEQYNTLSRIIYEEDKTCNDGNIINLCLMMESAKMIILYTFLTNDIHGNPIIRFTFFASEKRENLMVLDFDIATGLSLIHIMELQLFTIQEWYDSRKEVEQLNAQD